MAMETFLYILLVQVAAYFGFDQWLGARGHHGQKTDHFDGKKFHNIDPEWRIHKGNAKAFIRWLFHRPRNDWKWRKNVAAAKPLLRVFGGIVRVTNVNHATFLIQTNGLNVLTDPIWSKQTSPVGTFGPKRYREPGIAFDDLPPIDIVLISHNHYDHMDIATLRRLQKKWNPAIYAGLGNKEYLAKLGIRSSEMDWWDRETLKNGVTLVMVPAQHFSSRATRDRNRTLWGGFVLESTHGNIYFAGDTGYGPFLNEIKKRYDKFFVALLPIGAYMPQFFMQPVHMSPTEAYRAARELKVTNMIPIHFGTFRLADDKQDQPLVDLSRAVRHSPSPVKVSVLENGQMKEF